MIVDINQIFLNILYREYDIDLPSADLHIKTHIPIDEMTVMLFPDFYNVQFFYEYDI